MTEIYTIFVHPCDNFLCHFPFRFLTFIWFSSLSHLPCLTANDQICIFKRSLFFQTLFGLLKNRWIWTFKSLFYCILEIRKKCLGVWTHKLLLKLNFFFKFWNEKERDILRKPDCSSNWRFFPHKQLSNLRKNKFCETKVRLEVVVVVFFSMQVDLNLDLSSNSLLYQCSPFFAAFYDCVTFLAIKSNRENDH